MDSGNNSFHLEALSDEDIEKMGLSLADVWMLKTPSGRAQGPFSTEMLKKDSQERPAFYEECEVYNLVTENPKSFYTLPEFQRRRPKLIPAQNLIKNDTFLVLQHGQKTGPFSLEELQEKISTKEVSLNQEVSVDEGKTWIKLYEHHAFDRRARAGQDELPFQPNINLFEHVDEKISAKVVALRKRKDSESAISGLAFIGRGNDKGQRISYHKASEEKPAEPKNTSVQFDETERPERRQRKTPPKRAVQAAACVLLAALIGGGIFLNGSGQNENERLGETATKDADRINNSERNLGKRRPASIPKAQKNQPSRPKRYVPPKREQGKYVPRSKEFKRGHKNERPDSERISHTYEDFESLDMDDPKVREELARELAGDYYEEQNKDYEDYDAQGNYPEDEYAPEGQYEEMDSGLNKRRQEPPLEDEVYEDYPEERAQEPAQEAPYEEYGDFE